MPHIQAAVASAAVAAGFAYVTQAIAVVAYQLFRGWVPAGFLPHRCPAPCGSWHPAKPSVALGGRRSNLMYLFYRVGTHRDQLTDHSTTWDRCPPVWHSRAVAAETSAVQATAAVAARSAPDQALARVRRYSWLYFSSPVSASPDSGRRGLTWAHCDCIV